MVEVCRHIGALEMWAKMYAFVLPDGVADSFKEKQHSLKDVNILPLIKWVRTETGQPKDYARILTSKRTEEMPLEEPRGHFEGITGEDSRDILKICDLDFTGDSHRLLLHHTIKFANEFCQPKGQEL